MGFQVGDRVKWHEHIGEIIWIDIDNEYFTTKWNDYLGQTQDKIGFMSQLQLISRKGEGMGKYEQIKARIEKVEGWTAATNELIHEIGMNYVITIPTKDKARMLILAPLYELSEVGDETKRTVVATFGFNSQCSKNTAFKQALMWLLDNSSIKKDDKSEKIAELVRKLQELTAEIEKLRGEV